MDSVAYDQSLETDTQRILLADGALLSKHPATGSYLYSGGDPLLGAFFSHGTRGANASQKAALYARLRAGQSLSPVRIILSGSFCTGKTTLGKILSSELGIPKLIDDSTRAMRPGEKEGFPYHFISHELFAKRLADGSYFEAIDFSGASYGVPKAEVAKDRWSIDLKPSSFSIYRAHLTGVLGIYLQAPNDEELTRRARLRGDSEESIQRRLALAHDDTPDGFDYILAADLSMDDKAAQIRAAVFNLLAMGQP